MAHQKLYHFHDIAMPYLIATWRRPYCFLLYFDLYNIPSVILYAIGEAEMSSHNILGNKLNQIRVKNELHICQLVGTSARQAKW